MGEVIVYNISNDFIYLKLPNEYDCIYKELIKALSNTGIKGLLDCNKKLPCSIGTCGYTTEELMDSWNMFQIACAAYELEEVEKADKIINFIIKRMKFSCPTIIRKYSKIIYYGEYISGEPTIEIILAGKSINFFESSQITIPSFQNIQYIALPEGITISSVTKSDGDHLSLEDDFLMKNIIINGEPYSLWWLNYPNGLDTVLTFTLIEIMEEIETVVYYGQSDTRPDLSVISNNSKFDLVKGKSFTFNVSKKGHFVAVPNNFYINSIENASFRGDFLYNRVSPDSPDFADFYTKSNIILNNKIYNLYYCEFPLPLNANIEVTFDL